MRRLFQAFVIAATALASCGGRIAYAQALPPGCGGGNPAVLKAYDSEEITVSTVALRLTATKYQPAASGGAQPLGAQMAVMSLATDTVNYFLDGTAPTSTTGHGLAVGAYAYICRNDMPTFRVIRSGSADARLTVTYFRVPQS